MQFRFFSESLTFEGVASFVNGILAEGWEPIGNVGILPKCPDERFRGLTPDSDVFVTLTCRRVHSSRDSQLP